MRRTVAVAASIATLIIGLYLGSRWRVHADTETPPAKHAETHIAVINLSYVIKTYKKAQNLDEEFQKQLQGYDDELKKLAAQVEDMKKQHDDPATTAAKKAELGGRIKQIEISIKDKTEKYKGKLSAKRQEQVAILYQEVQQSVAALARSKGIDLVLHYNDLPPGPDRDSGPNIMRKLSAEACIPIYRAQGIDLSDEVIAALNKEYDRASGEKTSPEK
jgi:Skp family chaperone for outer membrane proteins